MNRNLFNDNEGNNTFSLSGISITPNIVTPHKSLSPTILMLAATSSRTLQNTMIEDTREQCNVLLVKSALENVATLSALEGHLQMVAPAGSNRYKMLLDTYTISLAMRLAKGVN